jgi:hypothetical protein
MLTLYRRHLKRCSKADDRYWKRCSCPMWVEGASNSVYIRRSLQTASWERAQGRALEIESADDPKAMPAKNQELVTLEKSVKGISRRCQGPRAARWLTIVSALVPMAQMKPSSSRATAVVIFLLSLPAAASLL